VKLQIFGKGAAQATKTSITFPPRRGTSPDDDAPKEGMGQSMKDASDPKDKRAVPEEVGGETTPAPVVAAPRRPIDRHISRTVSSPIPAMLAETMGLAEEHEPAPRPPESTPPRR
jgi:hypothetical protein